MINLVVLLEQSLRLVSFRPLLRLPNWVAMVGVAGCLFAMFVVNPAFSIVAIVAIVTIHTMLVRRHLRAPFGDVRSGLYVALAEWAAKQVAQLAVSRQRTWKANLLVPVERTEDIGDIADLVQEISYPKGFLKLVGLTTNERQMQFAEVLEDRSEQFRKQGVFASWTVMTAAAFGENLQAGIETFGAAFFKPNIVLLRVPHEENRRQEVADILQTCKENKTGVLLLCTHLEKHFGAKSIINVWFTEGGPDWRLNGPDLGPHDLALLIGYKLKLNWKGRIQLVAKLDADKGKAAQDEAAAARAYLELVAEMARIPNARITLLGGNATSEDWTRGDINILPLPDKVNLGDLCDQVEAIGSSCLFTSDSGEENALT